MSRSALLLLLALLAFSVTYLDHRAASCGDGFVLSPSLPTELRAEWFNGTFWLTDGEGWGLVGLPGETILSDGTAIDVQRVEAYRGLGRHGVMLQLRLAAGELALLRVSVEPAGKIRMHLDRVPDGGSWIRVTPENCNRLKLARTGVVVVGAALLAIAVRSWRAKAVGP